MKNYVTKIIAIFLASVISITGVEAVVANFCCDNCITLYHLGETCPKHNTEIKKQHSCCSSHNEDIETTECIDNHADDNCCSIERISIDLDSVHFKHQLNSPFTSIISSWIITDIQVFDRLYTTKVHSYPEDPPELFTPRTYLAFIRTLII
ncbi:hypothetical protein D0T53_04565 [Dysgonomonas sp. 216]|uniref:hypothetical protein n=1 Tax=Dysgonomonas sp. 216 TaxID=2302934 RepID=UPI0013D882F3|nr:hypothetical protein [Dysgonomonas sp. 216]NDW18191.1 hypothetical protein [Dysgonomonas sp. 216]